MELPKYNIPQARIFSLFLTELCNKKCYYCDIPYIKNPKEINEKLLYKYLPLMESEGNFERYTLTGGETGLVKEHILKYIFETIDTKKHPIKVNTNGLFIENGYYEKYKEYINEVGYHPIIEPFEEIPYDCLDEKFVIYMPFHKLNMHHLKPLLLRYPKLRFNPIPYICKKTFDNEKYIISYDDLQFVKSELDGLPNLDYGTFTSLLLKIPKESYWKFRLGCQNSNTRYSFNFVSGNIGRCPESISLNDKVEMNEINIKKCFELNLFNKEFKIVDKACSNCYYFDSFIPYYIKNELLKNK